MPLQRTILPQSRLKVFLGQRGFPVNPDLTSGVVKMRDGEYGFATVEWVQGPFGVWFKQWVIKKKFIYRKNNRDCDKFARAAAYWAAEAASESEEALQLEEDYAAGLGFGEVWFSRPAHAINIGVFVDPNGGLIDRYFEPQLSLKGGQIIKVAFNEVEVTREMKEKAELCLIG